MFGDPRFLNITQATEMGLWPMKGLPAYGMLPYLKRLPVDESMGSGLVGVEVGVLKGENMHVLLDQCPKISLLYGVDHYEAHVNHYTSYSQDDMNNFRRITFDNLKPFDDRAAVIDMRSKAAAEHFTNCFEGTMRFDFVLLDADHTKEGMMADLESYYPLLKPRGLIFITNSESPVINEVVKEFKNKHRQRDPIQHSINQVLFWGKQ